MFTLSNAIRFFTLFQSNYFDSVYDFSGFCKTHIFSICPLKGNYDGYTLYRLAGVLYKHLIIQVMSHDYNLANYSVM